MIPTLERLRPGQDHRNDPKGGGSVVMCGRARFFLGVFVALCLSTAGGLSTAAAQCVAEVCDGLDNDCDGVPDDDVYGHFYSVFQQPSLTFGVAPVLSGGAAEAYYGYGTAVAQSSNTPDGIERTDKLVLFVHEAPDGTASLGLVFDEPIPEGGISTATGGHAELEIVDTALVPVVLDDPGDVYGDADGTLFEWDWLPGTTDGAVLQRADGRPFQCVTISIVNLVNINGIFIVDGATGELIPFDSASNAITICRQLCCTPTGPEVCDGTDNDCDTEFDEGILPLPTTCGVGVCAATGETTCVDGREGDSCQPGLPTGADDDCDGVDQDCDGTADEHWVAPPTACGTGACVSEGALECLGGVPVDTCEPLPGSDEVCDGLDNDCDGAVDDGIPTEPTTCGVGACARSGELACVDGAMVDGCVVGAPTGADDDCDAVDQNCTGTADENYVPTATACGLGACHRTGERVCQNGALVDTCVAGAPSAEVCDGVDNDCDGHVDEDLGTVECGAGDCHRRMPRCRDGAIRDCEPGLPSPERCDGRDNDCDGELDEETSGIFFSVFQQPSQTFPVTAITGATSGADYYGYGLLAPESANTPDGIETEDALTLFLYDEPGDGFSLGMILDEPLIPGDGGISQASGGRARIAVDGRYSVTLRDDPSDSFPRAPSTVFEWRWGPGTTDGALLAVDNFERAGCLALSPQYFEKIYDINIFDATTGEHVYFDSLSNPITICSQICCSPTGDEVCDGIDNDCDGLTDEDLADLAFACGEGVCRRDGVERCVDGAWVATCTPGDVTGADDDCDDLDDDCDGATDEHFVVTPTNCGRGACAATGERVCVDGLVTDTCQAGAGSAELCNLVDDDCDGRTDEGFGTESCGSGECFNTVNRCENGQLQSCAPLPGLPEICDGRDNDCDGDIDEDTDGVFFSVFQQPSQTFSVTAVHLPGVGAAEYYGYGTGTAASANTPDGLEVEDALVLYVYRDDLGQASLGLLLDEPIMPGGGISTATGGTATLLLSDDAGGVLVADDPDDTLAGGLMGDEYVWSWGPGTTDGAVVAMDPWGCVTITPRAFQKVNRILMVNGNTLEHIAFDSTSNPITICTQSCCAPTGAEECNALDDDCDGLTDNLPPQPTACGAGACAATGEEVCLDGEWVDTCEPGDGTAEECNGADDDCDGATDEDLPVTPTTCGVGACAGSGERRCEGGEWVDTCEAVDPQPEVCDGVDNDCDGLVDEGFGTVVCGVGACRREVPECLDGVLQVCVSGLPSDEECNGRDDDCDGETDEGALTGWYYELEQGAQRAPVAPVGGGTDAVSYYNYGTTALPHASWTPDRIEREDALVVFVHEDAAGAATVGTIFDLPIRMGSGTGISNATGGTAALQVVAPDFATLPVALRDDPDDTFDQGTPAAVSALWSWQPGNTDGALFGPFAGAEWCLDLYPGPFQGVDHILGADGADAHVALGSTAQPFSVCKVSCCLPSDEVCDGVDNDCDGLVDEDQPVTTFECGGPGDCRRTGTRECIDGRWVEECTPGEPCQEVCDGHDNDCDGETDEGLSVGTTRCGEGACAAEGEYVCLDGEWVDTCEPLDPGAAEICGDAIDNDCDGVEDEDCFCVQRAYLVSDPYTDADGAPAVWTYDEHPAWTADIEDAIWIWDGALVADPSVDQTVAFTRTFFVPEEAGMLGVPLGGVLTIASDNGYTVTVNGAPLASVADSNNYGDAAKDQYPLFGLLQAGVNTFEFTVTNYGEPGSTPQSNPAGLLYRVELWFLAYPADEVCDAIDNDCDGDIDEGFGSVTCGVGACENTVDECWHGMPLACVPGEPGDEVCDGLDNDCDGLTDEDLTGAVVTCGEGACAHEGHEVCEDGRWVADCAPLLPDDEVCNALDDDCDGLTDEDLTGAVVTCGEGACANEGREVCVDGTWVEDCEPLEPGPELCNDVDDDCDGLVDEGCAFQLCEFVASGSEKVPSPSWLRESDRRAGSLEFNFNGGHGYNGENTDFPYAAGFFTLRNGAGQLVEQLQVNRRWHPPLDENGCSIGWVYPQCWLWPDGEELIEAFIPTWSTGSNSGFDDPLDRVEVSGGALMDFTVGEPMDNSHETMVFTFTDPAGLDTAQMIFRGRFDWDLDGLDVDDVMIPIFRRNMPGNGPDFIAPFVAIVAESATEITLSVNVAEALDFVRAAYDALGFFDAP